MEQLYVDGRPLREIASSFRTDKHGVHRYADNYERHFASKRFAEVTLLEIGIGGEYDELKGGESLRMWKEFFPNGDIIGLDLNDKRKHAEDRITIVQGDQGDATFLDEVGRRYGPFDFVIDDGSHVCEHVITSFRALFRHLKPDGIYAIEDLETSYWTPYLGSSGRGRRRGTSMTFLKDLVDGLNHMEYDIPHYRPTAFDQSITSISFYHNQAFIQKGANTEASAVLAPHPRSERTFPRVGVPFRLTSWMRRRAYRDDALGRLLSLGLRAHRYRMDRRGRAR
jgi:hypothetical protein